MLDVEVNADEVFALFRRLQDPELFDPLLKQAGDEFVERMSDYPPERHGKHKFKSDKERRGFFYYLRRGLIEVPYRRGQSPRSERLGKKWVVTRLTGGHWLVYNTASYAPLVHGRKRTRYHKRTGWLTVREGWLKYGRDIQRKWKDTTQSAILRKR
jgi:hypothetical protein